MPSRNAAAHLVKMVRRACDGELRIIGFRREGPIYVYEMDRGFMGWLGLNEALYEMDGSVGINPVVGVRSNEVTRLVHQLSGRKQSVTISTNIGYIMPQDSYYSQLFRSEDDVDFGAKELSEVVRVFGLRFMRGHSNLEALRHSLEMGLATDWSFSLPVVYLLLGDTDLARQRIEARLIKLRQKPSPYTDQYIRFAQRVATFSRSQ